MTYVNNGFPTRISCRIIFSMNPIVRIDVSVVKRIVDTVRSWRISLSLVFNCATPLSGATGNTGNTGQTGNTGVTGK